MNRQLHIAFRADAGSGIGIGHVMRCVTLARTAITDGWRATLVTGPLPSSLEEPVLASGIRTISLDRPFSHETSARSGSSHSQREDAAATVEALVGHEVDMMVVDHYDLDCEWEQAVNSRLSVPVGVIDDLADRRHQCDVLLDQNLVHGMEARYCGLVPPNCRLLLGPRWALLSESFDRMRTMPPRTVTHVGRILVSFGGSDPAGLVLRTLPMLERFVARDVAVDVVLGPAYEGDVVAPAGIRLISHTQDMSGLMERADLAIGAGGSTSWERCAAGLPAIVITVAQNQIEPARALHDAGAILYLGNHDEVSDSDIMSAVERLCASPETLSEMSVAAKKQVSAVPGGPHGVIAHLKEVADAHA